MRWASVTAPTLPDVRERLLEPVVGERLVVERLDLDPAGRAVQRKRLAEDGARLDPCHPRAAAPRGALQAREQAAPEPEPARRGRDPHALGLARGAGVVL